MYSRKSLNRTSVWQLTVRLWRRLSERSDTARPDSILWCLLGVDVFQEDDDA